MTTRFAERARALAGTRFRPQGRDPALGLDCVGLVLSTFDLPANTGRQDYRIRGDHRLELMRTLDGPFRRIARTRRRTGDLVVMQVAREQWHLAVITESGFVHADARIGKVVETAGALSWPIAAVYRRRVRKRKQG